MNQDIFVLELDGERSDSITPLSPARRAQFEKVRAMYVKAGLIRDVPLPPATAPESSPLDPKSAS